MIQALEGIKVIDLTRLAPGPYCTMILADLGADVIRVEEFGPLTGRRAEQSKGATISYEEVGFPEIDSPFNILNRNKKSIALNLKISESRQAFYKLVKGVDVVVEEFRPGTAERLGVDYETLSQINPRLIYCAITGYGQDGPYRNLAGHDINYISMTGALGIWQRGNQPMIPSNLLADFAGGGMNAATAILAALIAREKTGRGQFVDVAMADGVLSLLSQILSWHYATGRVPRPDEHVTIGAFPCYNVYKTKDDKYISLGCVEPWFWANLCRVVGREDFIPYQYDTGAKRDEIFTYFREVFQAKDRDEWFQILSQTDICVGKVYTLDELDSNPQIQHRGMIVEIEDATLGKVKQVGTPFKLSDTPPQIRQLTSKYGQHTEEILHALGYTREEVDDLRQLGAIN